MRKRANKKEQADIDNIQAENTAQHHAQQNSDSTTASFSEYFDKSSIKVEETSDSGTSTSHEEFADASEIELDLDLEQDKDDSISTVEKSQTIEATFRELNTFIAYGKHDSAEQLLRDELAKTPAEIRLHIRLFELFAETNRSDDYKQHLVSISQLTDSDADFLQHIEQLYLDTWNQPLKATF